MDIMQLARLRSIECFSRTQGSMVAVIDANQKICDDKRKRNKNACKKYRRKNGVGPRKILTPEETKQYRHDWYIKNRERVALRMKSYYQVHRNEVIARVKENRKKKMEMHNEA